MNETSLERKHRMMVADLAKKPEELNLTDFNINLMHAALGIAGEAGEVVDLIKKSAVNGVPLDVVELTKELGDLAWYLTLLRSTVGIDHQVVLQMNIAKLRERYPEGYTDEAASARADLKAVDPQEELWAEEDCLHPTLKWNGFFYVCPACGERAATSEEDIA